MQNEITKNKIEKFLAYYPNLEKFEEVALAPNQKFLVTSQVARTNRYLTASNKDYGLHYWDLETNKKIRFKSNIKHLTTAITISSNSKLIATGGFEDAVRVFDAKTKKIIFRSKNFKNHRAHSLAFSPDNKYLALSYMCFGDSFLLIVWNLQTKQPVFDLDAVYIDAFNITFTEDSKFLITDKGNSIDVFDKNLVELNRSTHPECVATSKKYFSNHQALIIDADSSSEHIKVINPATEKVLHSFYKGKYQTVKFTKLIKNDTQLLIVLERGEVKLCDLIEGTEIKTFFNLKDDQFVQIDSLGNYSFSSTRLPNLILKKAKEATKALVEKPEIVSKFIPLNKVAEAQVSLATSSSYLLSGHRDGYINQVVTSSDGSLVASLGPEGDVKVWQAKDWTPLPVSIEPNHMVEELSFSHDSKYLITVPDSHDDWDDNRTKINFWDIQTSKLIKTFIPEKTSPEDEQSGYEVVFTPDNKTALLIRDKKVIFLNLETFEVEREQYLEISPNYRSTSLSADKKHLIFCDEKQYYLLNLLTGEALLQVDRQGYHQDSIFDLASKQLALRIDNDVEIYSLETYQKVFRISSNHFVHFKFSPDNTKLALGTMTGQVVLWCMEKQSKILDYDNEKVRIEELSFSHDSEKLYIFTATNELLTLDCRNQNKLEKLQLNNDQFTGFAISSKNKTLALAGVQHAHLFKLDNFQKIRGLRLDNCPISPNKISIAISPNADKVAVNSYDHGGVQIWDLTNYTHKTIAENVYTRGGRTAFSFSHKNRISISSGEIFSQGFHIYNYKNSKRINAYATQPHKSIRAGNFEGINAIYTADGKYLISLQSSSSQEYSPSLLHIREANSKKIIKTYEGDFYGKLASSPNGKLISCLNEQGNIVVLDLEQEKYTNVIADSDRYTASLAFLNNTVLVYKTKDNFLRFYDLTKNEIIGGLAFYNKFKDWVFLTPTGDYDYSSKDCEKFISTNHKNSSNQHQPRILQKYFKS